jgi:hypothetical protein
MPRGLKLFRYRRPGINQLLGITQAKRKVSRELGLATLRDPTTPLKNMQRKALRKVGYYSEPMKAARASGCAKRMGGLFLITMLVIAVLSVFFSYFRENKE